LAKIEAWFRACGCTESSEAEVRAGLRSEGIHFTPLQRSVADSQYGIVCFSQITDELLAVLETAARKSCRTFAVAVAVAKNALPVWQLLHAGASDALTWDSEGVAAKQIGAKLSRWAEIDDMANAALAQGFIVGESSAWRALVRRVIEAAHYTTSPILLTGESGTGKELLARLVSAVSRRDSSEPRRELVTVDCGTLVPELSGSEFFGHERGAFTGAHTQREGAFALANGATLFLDEIAEIPLSMQAQILRSIQEKTYKRLGGNVWQSTNFRLVSATNRDLKDLVHQGKFRLDLYYRIAGSVFCTPPLRERRDDVLALSSHFLSKILSKDAPEFDTHLREYLLNGSYPGNVRELSQLMERIAVRYAGTGPVTVGDLPEEDRPLCEFSCAWPDKRFERSITEALTLGVGLKEINQITTRTAIRMALDSENGNLHRAATRLGVTDRALQLRRAADQSARKRRTGVGSYDTDGAVPAVVRHSGWRDGEGSNAESLTGSA
jgi:transcriptional regulator with GAF, ATPase, and Fis domain